MPACATIDAASLDEAIRSDAVTVIDLSPSPERMTGHIRGTWFAIRSDLPRALARLTTVKSIVLVSTDGLLAAFAAAEVTAVTGVAPRVLIRGLAGWRACGLDLHPGIGDTLSPPLDRYRRPYLDVIDDRVAMQAYLEWEHGLVDQLARDETHGFVVI